MGKRKPKAALTPEARADAMSAVDACVLLDAVILGEDRPDLTKTLRNALLIAQIRYRELFPRAPKTRRPHYVWHTVAIRYPGPMPAARRRISEYDYRCFYCGESLNTLPPKSGYLPAEFVDALDRHGEECALRFLMMPDFASPGMTPQRSVIAKRLRAMHSSARRKVARNEPTQPVVMESACG